MYEVKMKDYVSVLVQKNKAKKKTKEHLKRVFQANKTLNISLTCLTL